MITDDYFAGLFDGEGWFQIRRAKGSAYRSKREWAYQCSAALTIREKELVDALQQRFGGTVVLQKSRSDKHSPYWKWRVGGRQAFRFAMDLECLLIAKRKQASLLMLFQNEKAANGNRPVTDERYEYYGECFDRMKKLNERGVGK